MVRRILREPLLHFLVCGGLLFVLYGIVSDGRRDAPDRIVVGEDRVASLAATFRRTWLRPPSRQELEGLIQDFVDEEILYREGLALGLDRDDLIVRRRLRQKMEFLNAEVDRQESPSDAELSAFLATNVDRFREPARLSFRQVFVRRGEGASEAQGRARELLRKLAAGAPQGAIEGDPTLLPATMAKVSERDVASAFGAGFAGEVFARMGDDWFGPVASGYGLHLVRVEARTAARTPSLDEVRPQVEREYEAARRTESNRRFLQELRGRYEVEIRIPRRAPGPQLSSLGE